jgi:hypothetical protein
MNARRRLLLYTPTSEDKLGSVRKATLEVLAILQGAEGTCALPTRHRYVESLFGSGVLSRIQAGNHCLVLGYARRSLPRVYHRVLAPLPTLAPKAPATLNAGATPLPHSHSSQLSDETSMFLSGSKTRKSGDPFDLGIDEHLFMAFDLVTVCMNISTFFSLRSTTLGLLWSRGWHSITFSPINWLMFRPHGHTRGSDWRRKRWRQRGLPSSSAWACQDTSA